MQPLSCCLVAPLRCVWFCQAGALVRSLGSCAAGAVCLSSPADCGFFDRTCAHARHVSWVLQARLPHGCVLAAGKGIDLCDVCLINSSVCLLDHPRHSIVAAGQLVTMPALLHTEQLLLERVPVAARAFKQFCVLHCSSPISCSHHSTPTTCHWTDDWVHIHLCVLATPTGHASALCAVPSHCRARMHAQRSRCTCMPCMTLTALAGVLPEGVCPMSASTERDVAQVKPFNWCGAACTPSPLFLWCAAVCCMCATCGKMD